MNSRIAILTGPASPEILTAARRSRFIFLLARGDGDLTDFRKYLPNALVADMKVYRGLGRMWTLQPEQSAHLYKADH